MKETVIFVECVFFPFYVVFPTIITRRHLLGFITIEFLSKAKAFEFDSPSFTSTEVEAKHEIVLEIST